VLDHEQNITFRVIWRNALWTNTIAQRNRRADEVAVQHRMAAHPQGVVPNLMAMVDFPAVGALENGDDELLGSLRELGERQVLRLHAVASSDCSSSGVTRTLPVSRSCIRAVLRRCSFLACV